MGSSQDKGQDRITQIKKDSVQATFLFVHHYSAGLIDGAITAEWRLSGFVGGFIAIVELMSIVENFGKITGNDLFDRLKEALGKKHEHHHH